MNNLSNFTIYLYGFNPYQITQQFTICNLLYNLDLDIRVVDPKRHVDECILNNHIE